MRSLPVLSILLVLRSALALGTSSPAESGARTATTGLQLATIHTEAPHVLRRATDLGRSDPAKLLYVSVNMEYAKPEEAQRFADSVSDSTSPNYRRFLAPEEIGARFGISSQQLDDVVAYLRVNGFQINLVTKNHLAVLAQCTVAQAESAFHTEIHEYSIVPQNPIEPARFHSYNSALQVPSHIAPVLLYVGGLENYSCPERRVDTLSPAQASTLYDAAPILAAGFNGQGRTIGVSNFDGFRLADAVRFINHFNLPVPQGGAGSNITVVPCNGGGMGAGTTNAEGDLDLQMEVGQAPLADIRVYDSPPGADLLAVLGTEGNDNRCDVISESYGWFFTQQSGAIAAHNAHLTLTMEGTTYMAASGDHGTVLEPYSYPDYDPEVLSIGGTTAATDAAGNRQTEAAWSMGGGGWSTNTVSFNVRPSWQTGNGVPAVNPVNNYRLVPDISFHSAGQDGNAGAYYFYTSGSLSNGYIGTSFASPMFAGLLGVTEHEIIASFNGLSPDASGHRRFGRIQDYIYSQNGRPDIWHDITSGQNGINPDGTPSLAAAGWDTASGWGPMDCAAFAPIAACDTGGSCGQGIPFCAGDGTDPNVTAFCPCVNFGAPGHGCENSSTTGGAILTASGTTTPDTIVMNSAGEKPTSFSILFQGTASDTGHVFGDGVRCVSGVLKRLYSKNAVAGVFTAPSGGDPSITSRSAALGDVITPGSTRYYQTWYRDPVPGFCPSATSNVSNGWIVTWN